MSSKDRGTPDPQSKRIFTPEVKFLRHKVIVWFSDPIFRLIKETRKGSETVVKPNGRPSTKKKKVIKKVKEKKEKGSYKDGRTRGTKRLERKFFFFYKRAEGEKSWGRLACMFTSSPSFVRQWTKTLDKVHKNLFTKQTSTFLEEMIGWSHPRATFLLSLREVLSLVRSLSRNLRPRINYDQNFCVFRQSH